MNDPRLPPDFDPALYPRCDNGSPPAELSADRVGSAQLAFLAAYYELNRTSRALLTARVHQLGPAAEREALQAIERALLARDALEDNYAPFGISATPEFVDGVVTNVNFLQPPSPQVGSSISMLFAVQPPADSVPA